MYARGDDLALDRNIECLASETMELRDTGSILDRAFSARDCGRVGAKWRIS